MTRLRATVDSDARSPAPLSPAARAPPGDDHQRQGRDERRQQTAGEQGGDRQARRHRADRDEHQARRDCLGHGARRRQQRRQFARVGAAAAHLGEEDRRDRGHVGGLRSGNPRHQVHRAEEHVGQPASHMADQRGEEVDHHPRDSGHLHQHAEEHEHRHRQQQQVRDAVIHAVDDDQGRQVGREGQIRQGRDAEGERNRHADGDARHDEHDKEQDQAAETHRHEQRLRDPQPAGNRADHGHGRNQSAQAGGFQQPQQREDAKSARSRPAIAQDAVPIRDVQRDQLGRRLQVEIGGYRNDDLEHEDDDHQLGHDTEPVAQLRADTSRRRWSAAYDRRGAPQRPRRTSPATGTERWRARRSR